MNKYLVRGILLTVLGIGIGLAGGYLQSAERDVYKWVYIAAVVVFGIGFLTIVYSLIRKIERKSILDQRQEQQEDNE
jgi:TRAP-type C4-dicarboxylate transport system permease small subunit